MPRALLLLALAAGCVPAAAPPAAAPPTSAPTARTPAPALVPEVEEPPTEDKLLKLAEPLPDAPKADPTHAHKPLTPGGELLLETKPDPADPKKAKPVRVLLKAEVCLRTGPLELLLCRERTKEHEAIVRTPADAKLVHAALIAAGLKPGTPVQFVDPKSGDEAYKPATGAKVAVTVHYRRAGKLHTHPAQEWVREFKTQKAMTQTWVFAGSILHTDPENPDRPPYYAANGGDVVSLSNFPTAMLDLPVMSSQDNNSLGFEALPDKIPPLRSKVWVILGAGR